MSRSARVGALDQERITGRVGRLRCALLRFIAPVNGALNFETEQRAIEREEGKKGGCDVFAGKELKEEL